MTLNRDITFHSGRKPNDPAKPRLMASRFLSAVSATYPSQCDWISGVEDWPMYLNDQIGDCTFATIGHTEQIFTHYGQRQTVKISDDDVLAGYMAVTGYDPQTGANDNGAVEQDVLNYWRTNGVGGHKILAFAELDVNNQAELKAALSLFGTLYLGIEFPDSAMTQFNQGKPWDVVEGANVEGGHAINAAYYDETGWKIVTWGAVQDMTQAFWDRYVREAWLVISQEWVDTNAQNPNGISLDALGEEFTALTGEPNPFPVSPEPVDPPAPVVEPNSTETLKAAAQEWLSHRHTSKYNKPLVGPLTEWLADQS